MKFADVKIGQRFKFAFESKSRWTYVKDTDKLYTEVDRPPTSPGPNGLTWNIGHGFMGDEKVVILEDK